CSRATSTATSKPSTTRPARCCGRGTNNMGNAFPITYSVHGKQDVAVATRSRSGRRRFFLRLRSPTEKPGRWRPLWGGWAAGKVRGCSKAQARGLRVPELARHIGLIDGPVTGKNGKLRPAICSDLPSFFCYSIVASALALSPGAQALERDVPKWTACLRL